MEKRSKRKYTMLDVAKRANVAIGTVSNVINNTANTSEATKKRVTDAIKELNYVPNSSARALRAKESKLIGFMIPDATNDFYSMISKVFSRCAHAEGYALSVMSYDYDVRIEELQMRDLIDRNVDAIIMFNGYRDDQLIRKIKSESWMPPLILADRRIEGFPSIEFENKQTLVSVVDMLVKKGYRRIGYFSESIESPNLHDRYDGFLQGMKANNLVVDEKNVYVSKSSGNGNLAKGYEHMKKLLSAMAPAELAQVYITSSDLIAVGAMRAVREAGLRIPQDIAIMGFDNIPLSEYTDPPLTTVDQDTEKMALTAWETVHSVLCGNSDKPQVKLKQTIIERSSC